MTKKQNYLDNCTFIKTILMVLVVFCHAIDFWTGTRFTRNPVIEAPGLDFLSKWLGSFHIYTFTLVSGAIFCFVKYDRGGYSKFAPFVMNKIKRLLVPYIFISFIWAGPIAKYFLEYDAKSIIMYFVMGIAPGQLWFLLMLFDVFIIFWLLSDFFYWHDIFGAVVVIGFYGIGIVGTMVVPNIFQIWTACQYITFFWIGFKIYQKGSELIERIPSFMCIIADIVFFLIIQLIPTEGFVNKILSIGLTYFLHIIGSVMAFVVLQKIANKFKWKAIRSFSFVSEQSMAVYLFHQQFVYFSIVLLNGVINPYLHAVINFIVAMTGSLVLSTVLLKFKVTRVMIGEKT